MQSKVQSAGASMRNRSDIEQIMLVRRAIEHLIAESTANSDTERYQEYLRLVDELKVEVEREGSVRAYYVRVGRHP
jgi:hypothetical protein